MLSTLWLNTGLILLQPNEISKLPEVQHYKNRIVAIMYRVSQKYFDILLLKIEQILTELQELEDQNAVNHETSDLFHSGCYMMYMCA